MQGSNKYKFYFKKVDDLTQRDKEQMMQLMIATYPTFKEYYLKNKYYSAVKPQMENLIKDGDKLVGVGKFLWRKVMVGTKSIFFFAFGILIKKQYQGRGLGIKLIESDIKEARTRGADILYGSTSNLNAKRIVKKLGFKKLSIPVFYKDVKTKKIKRENDEVWVFEFKKGLLEKIIKLPKLYIGTGPL